ncbi:Ig-like domain-containing protein [Microvirga sp. TS319]|uniref:tandem-95 repeat protein n=1 Tax=Microvirga sp. TS319 TaxID=3241165 RepID=UPI00351A98BA
MTQQIDPTIPFDASVIDEEMLRALRAVQRSLSQGDGGASGILVSGIATAAMVATVQGGAQGGFVLGPDGAPAPEALPTYARQDEPLKPLDPALSNPLSIPQDFALLELLAPNVSAPASAITMLRGAGPHGSSDAVSLDQPSAPAAVPVIPAAPGVSPKPPVVTPPPVVRPPQDQPDVTAETPIAQAADAEGDEDQAIALHLTVALTDTDGSETLTVRILGVPDGAVLSHGHREPDGSWSVDPRDVADLTLTPPHDFSGRIELTMRVTSHERSGSTAVSEASFAVHVAPVADAPGVSVADAHGREDEVVSLAGLGGRLSDIDGSETLSFVLSGVPTGATLSAGTNLGGGRWALTEGQLSGLTLTPPENASGTFTMTLTAVATERVGGSSAKTSATFTLILDPVVDDGTIGGSSVGDEDQWIALKPTFAMTDRDGSETWSETTMVSGVPAGALLSQGREVAPGVWEVSTAALQAGLVSIKPPADSDNDFNLTLKATLTDTANGVSASREVSGRYGIEVTAVADAPSATASDVDGKEDQAIALKLTAALTDTDGSETLSVVILGVPDGASLSAGHRAADGSWHVDPADLAGLTLTPPRDFSGTLDLTLQATSRETANGAIATTRSPFQVHVDGEADAPRVDAREVTGQEDEPIALNLAAALVDTDGSEQLSSVTITGVPPGASLSRGSRSPDGTWVLDPSDLPHLVLTPPENYSGTLSLTVHVTSRETANGSLATTDVPFKVHVNAVADEPELRADGVAGKEDEAIALKLEAKLTDTDGSEVLSIRILGIPDGASLDHGTRMADGTWVVDPADLGSLKITPPKDFSGTIDLTLEATAREGSNGSVATSRTPFQVQVEAVADAPEITANGASGQEDESIPLNLSTRVADRDGSEEIASVVILGVPDGASLSAGHRAADGSWHVDPADLGSLKITPPKDFSGTIDLTLEATAREGSNGSVATSRTPFQVQVEAVADAPEITANGASGQEDESIPLNLSTRVADRDGSEEIASVVISGVPDGFSLTHGTPVGHGAWRIDPAELSQVAIVPPKDYSGTFNLTIETTSREISNGSQASSTRTFPVRVEAVPDQPTVGAHDASGKEDTPIALKLTAALTDTDGSETLSVVILGVPDGASLSAGHRAADGSWHVDPADLAGLTLTPPRDFSGTLDLTLQATSRETANGAIATTRSSFQVHVDGVADAPSVTLKDVSGDEDTSISLRLMAALTDTDGSETLSVVILGVPPGASLSHGARQPDGTWVLNPSDLPHLVLTPPENYSGDIRLTVHATSRESDGDTASTEKSFTVTVNPVADAPSATASDVDGKEDQAIALKLTAALTDTDGSETLSVVILGVPDGASLSAGHRAADGSWHVDPADLAGLTLTPPRDFSGTLDLTLQATSREKANGHEATTEVEFQVDVDAVADAPRVDAREVTGQEDEPIALNLAAALVDTDGSEQLSSVTITGVPPGASLSRGSRSPDGTWVLDPSDLPHLVLTPPENYSGTLSLTVHVTSRETANGSLATTDVPFKVHVNAVADEPELRADGVAGKEDEAIALKLEAKLTDTDGSEVLSIRILGIPDGASLDHGTRMADGTWVVDPADLGSLKITPPKDFSGTIDLTLEATAREGSNGSVATSRTPFQVQVEAVADAPEITANGASGQEDESIPLNLSTRVADRDGSEEIASVVISGVPDGFSLTHGTPVGHGAWRIDPAELSQVAIVPPKDYSGTFNLTIETTSREISNGSQASSTRTFPVRVEAVPDQPTVGAHDASGKEDTRITLDISAGLTDTDGSEVLSIVIQGLPAGTRLSAGVENADGSWTLTPAQLPGLTMTPPTNWSGTRTITVVAHSRETSSNLEATNSTTFQLDVDGVADAPSVILKNVSGDEDTAISLNLKVSLVDTDGSETLSVVISGVPHDAVLSHGTRQPDGTWSVNASDVSKLKLTPPHDFSGDIRLTVHATSRESDGDTASTEKSFTVTVNPVADAPSATASDVDGKEDQAIALKLTAALTDTDGSETLSVVILGVPDGASLSAGHRAADGSWHVDPADLAGLTLTPPRDFSGTLDLTLQATSREKANGHEATTEVEFQVDVDAVADAPGLRVSPAVGDEDMAIPLHVSAWATDRDNSERIVGFHLMDVPEGAVVMAGGVVLERDANGTILVPPGAIDTLTITPPPQSDVDFTLRVSAISEEPNGSRAESAPMDLPVTVRAVADMPTMLTPGASGFEDTEIPLDLRAATVDTDGSETITFVISNLPAGAILSEGTYRGSGIWSLTAEEAARVTLLPPPDFSGSIPLTVTMIAQERNGGDQKVSTIVFPVQVDAVVDRPAVGGLDGKTGDWGTMHGTEDKPIPLDLDPGLSDRDGSEKVVGDIIVSGIPESAVLKLADGTVILPDTEGRYRIPSDHMEGVTLTMPLNSDKRETLTIEMTIEDHGGVRATIGGHMVVDPLGDADPPKLEVGPSSGNGHVSIDAEQGWIPLHIAAELTDKDDSETLYMMVQNVPRGASLSDGSPVGNGIWLVPVASLPTLAIRPGARQYGNFDLQVTAIAVEREGDREASTKPLTVTVTVPEGAGDGGGGEGGGSDGGGDVGGGGTDPASKIAQPPTLTIGHATTTEDNAVALSIKAELADSDHGREALGIRIQGVPENARLSVGLQDPKTGDWLLRPEDLAKVELVPPPDFAGTITLMVTAVSQEATGSQACTTSPLEIVVTPVADAAVIKAAPARGFEDQPVDLNLDIRTGDSDDSETITSIILSGLTGGARIADGPGITNNGDGTWTVHPDHLSGVQVIPPPNGHGHFEVTVRVTTQETANGHATTTTKTVAFDVAPVADAPTVIVNDASGREDGSIDLHLSARLNDTDGSEVLSVVIEGLPPGARLTAGVNNGDGSWTLTPAQLSGLKLIPPADWSGTMDLTMHAHARERSNGSVESRSAPFQVQVEAVADAPLASARDVFGDEDTDIPLNLSASLVDRDGSETLSVVITGIPDGAVLSHGEPLGNNSWSVPPSALSHLTITPPHDFSGRIELSLQVTAREKNGSTATSEASFVVQVGGVADAPSVTVVDAHGREDTPVSLDGLGGALSDIDGSESLAFILSGVPEGATLSAGTDLGGGRWALTEAQLSGLTLNPPTNASGSYTLTLTGIATEKAGGPGASTSATFTVTVDPVADKPVVTASNVVGQEDEPIALRLTAALTDTDGSETLSILLTGVPEGFTLSAGVRNADGSWSLSASQLAGLTLNPPDDFSGSLNLTLHATATESATGDAITTEARFQVQVEAVADAPLASARDVFGDEDTDIPLNLSASLVDRDGSETLSVVITGIPDGAVLSHGEPLGNNSWSVPPSALSHLTITPPHDFSGRIELSLQVTAREKNGSTATSEASFVVQVGGVADAPSVTVVDAHGREDTPVSLDGLGGALSDIDGSESLAFILSGVPEGATLSAGTDLGGGRWALTEAQLSGLTLNPPHDFSGTLNLTLHATATESATGDAITTEARFQVQVQGVADAPLLQANDVTGEEDHAIALNLSAALSDTDGSEQLSSVTISGLPDGFVLSQGTMSANGTWRVSADMLSDVRLIPPQNWNGTLHLTLHATSLETASGSTATSSAPFTVTVAPVNDAPEVSLTAPGHSDAGSHAVSAIGGVQAEDVDSTHLSGATVTLSGGHPGDRLDFEGFALHHESGHVMIGDTGIELVGGGYDPATGSLSLSGSAPPDTYAAVLRALVLENPDGTGLAAGTRSIGVTLVDQEGAASVPKTVDVIVDDMVPDPVGTGEQGFAAASLEPAQDHLGSDVLLLIAESGGETTDTGSLWTEHLDQGPDHAAVPHAPADLDHLGSDQIQPINDFHVEIGRVNWS